MSTVRLTISADKALSKMKFEFEKLTGKKIYKIEIIEFLANHCMKNDICKKAFSDHILNKK